MFSFGCFKKAFRRYSNMGSHHSKHERQAEGSEASSSHKRSKDYRREHLQEEDEETEEVVVRNVVVREPLDKRDPWGHMARVVHDKHGSDHEWGSEV